VVLAVLPVEGERGQMGTGCVGNRGRVMVQNASLRSCNGS
jgi:hypothetical protein